MNPVSFSDDTSGHTAGRRHQPRVQADVLASSDLSWVKTLRTLVLSDPSEELKSDAVLRALPTLPTPVRALFFSSIQSVRIHITDPQPYELEAQDILLGFAPRRTIDVLGRLAKQQPKTDETEKLRKLLRTVDGYVRRRVTSNTVARRLARQLRAYARVLSVSPLGMSLMDEVGGVEREDETKENLAAERADVTAAVKTASKVATVFSRADDEVERTLETSDDLWFGVRLAAERSVAVIANEYAFDVGDSESTRSAHEQRQKYVAELRRDFVGFRGRRLGLLFELESDKFLQIQAADAASGWARNVLSEGGLGSLRSYFDYVTFNGQRVTADNLFEVQGRAGYIVLP